MARLYDGVDDAGTPYFSADHHRIDDVGERSRVGAYLASGEEVLESSGTMLDILAPELGNVVPVSYATDGTWIWCNASGYYARAHGIAPDPELLDHIRRTGYTAPAVDRATLLRAAEELRASWDDD